MGKVLHRRLSLHFWSWAVALLSWEEESVLVVPGRLTVVSTWCSWVDGPAIDGLAVDGPAVDDLAIDGLAVDGQRSMAQRTAQW